MGFTIRFDGAEQLLSKFKAMTEAARADTLRHAVEPARDFIKEAIFARAPVKTGTLASSLGVSVLVDTEFIKITGITIEPEAWYWKFVEFGTINTTANPFIRQAFYSSRTQAKNEIRDGIRDSILGFTK